MLITSAILSQHLDVLDVLDGFGGSAGFDVPDVLDALDVLDGLDGLSMVSMKCVETRCAQHQSLAYQMHHDAFGTGTGRSML